MNANDLARNAASLDALRALAAQLTPPDYARDLGDGWTVSMALAHLGFWDARGAWVLQQWAEGRTPPADEPSWYANGHNTYLQPAWGALAGPAAASLALEAGAAIDAVIAGLPVAVTDAVAARDELWRLRRFNHREEHITQISGVLRR